MPEIRPFRALRYEPDMVGNLAAVVSPPYDVISPAEQRALLARHPKNVVRLDLPADEPGDGPDDRYRRAARTFAAWRSDGTFRKDPRPSLYAYEQTYRLPDSPGDRTQRGFFGRLRLEPLGALDGVLPHERTLSAPKEDRYRLLRATGANFSPVVGLYADGSGAASAALERVAAAPSEVDFVADDGVRHRLWMVPGDGSADGPLAGLLAAAARGPITIADGHHRYETALRYRDERRMSRACEEDPAFDYILMLFLETTSEPPTVLPTHRVIRDLGPGALEDLWAGLGELFSVRPVGDRETLLTELRSCGPLGDETGRIGLWTRAGGAFLEAHEGAFEPWLPPGSEALRRLDVTLLEVALDRLCGIDREATASGGRVAYTVSAPEAISRVDADSDGADAAFLVRPTPVSQIVAVAAAGDVMPQKSTYFYPKPASGLLINPHEW